MGVNAGRGGVNRQIPRIPVYKRQLFTGNALSISSTARLIAFGRVQPQQEKKKQKNRSPKGNMWSMIPVALLCMVVNRNERKQGSGPEGDEVL